jgi:hypothetical protein
MTLLRVSALLLFWLLALPAGAETVTFASVEAGPVLVTPSGERVRLEKLRTPDEASILAVLTQTLIGRSFEIARHAPNRWGETVATLQPDPRPDILQKGLAQLETEDSSLAPAEAAAMTAQAGLWNLPCCRLLSADEASHRHDEWRIVRGRVAAVSLRAHTAYVNFGTDWKEDFTLSLSPTLARRLGAENWAEKTLLARGWLTLSGGGLIAVSNAAQIRLLQTP